MAEDVTKWLHEHGLGKYADVFEENEIGLADVPLLTEDHLRELGLPMGPRMRLLAAISKVAPVPKEGAVDTAQPSETPAAAPATGEAERRQLTVMFCDLVGSTELSQKLDPEEVREVNRAFESACEAGIKRYDGFLARYMGDGVLAYFCYPTAHEDDAERAIHGALEVINAVPGIKTNSLDALGLSPAVRVGIDTGSVVVEVIGEGAAQESAISGDAPNLAKRLQGLADENTVVIGPGTHRLAGERFNCESFGTHSLKGFGEPIQVWRVIAPAALESRFAPRQRVGLTPLVGREHEIGLLLDRWTQAKEGDGQVVLLSGEAGIGKSRITETLRERTADDDPVRLRYQCSPFYTNTALHPVIEQLERAAQFGSDDPNEVKLYKLETLIAQGLPDAKSVAPLFAPLLSIPTGGRYSPLEMTPESQKAQTLEALVNQMEGLSRHRPVLLIFEDVHWADPTSLELLELTIERVQHIPVFVVLTYRPEFLPPWGGHTHITSLTLNRFSRNLAAAMVGKVTGGKTLPDEVLEQIIEKTDGVPLFVEELTKTILESGQLRREADRFVATGTLQDVTIPATLHDSLMARLDRLGAVKDVAQTCAAIGREFDYDLLAVVSPLSFEKLRDAVNQLIDAELVFRRGRSEEGTYIFKHALVQDAAYGSLLKRRRQELHECIAQALKDRFPERVESEPELLAHHLTEAALLDEAVDQWKKAGLRAMDTSAFAEAVSHFTTALEIFNSLVDAGERPSEELSLQSGLASVLVARGECASREANKAYARARELCNQTGDTSQLFPLLYGRWNTNFVPMPQDALPFAEELLEVAERDGDRTHLMAAHGALTQNLTFLGQLDAVNRHAEKSIALYRHEEDGDLWRVYGEIPGLFSSVFRNWVLWIRGFPEKSLSESHSVIDMVSATSDQVATAWALTTAAIIHFCSGDHESADKFAQQATEYSTERDNPGFRVLAMVMKGRMMVEAGQLEDGLKVLSSAIEEWEAMGPGVMWLFLHALMAESYDRYGDVDEALRQLEKGFAQARRTGEQLWLPELHRLRGRFRMDDDVTECRACLETAIEVARKQGARSLELRAAIDFGLLCQREGAGDKGARVLGPIYGWFTEGSHTHDLKEAKALLDQLV